MTEISNLPKPVKLAFIKHEPSTGVDPSKAPVVIYHGIFGNKIAIETHPKKKLGPTKENKPSMVTLFVEMLIKTREKMRKENMDLEAAKVLLLETDEKLYKKYPDILTIRDGQIDWRFNLDVLVEFLKVIFQDPDITPDLKGPVLEVYGSVSDFVGKEDEESIKQMLPNTIFKPIEGADHILPATHPKEFLEIVIQFINA